MQPKYTLMYNEKKIKESMLVTYIIHIITVNIYLYQLCISSVNCVFNVLIFIFLLRSSRFLNNNIKK